MEQMHLQTKYLSFVSPSLERFKKVNTFLFNFRCPYCGDSQKAQTKARGYIYKNKFGLLSFQCHNCGENHHFKTFLKFVSPRLFQEYVLESFKSDERAPELETPEESKIEAKTWMKFLTPVSELSKIHPAVVYLKDRAIPKSKWGLFWYSANFKDFIEQMNLDAHVPNGPRLVLVETDRFGNLKIVIARAIGQSDLRYVTLKLDEAYPKMFGLSRLDFTKPVTIVEGAIDSLFLENCIAPLDSNLTSYTKLNLGINKPTLVWDNEPRNKEIVGKMRRAAKQGERVTIFPDTVKGKDINEMVLDGVDVASLINNNSYSGINALLKFSTWNRTDNANTYPKNRRQTSLPS